jgi:hypothetical protein
MEAEEVIGGIGASVCGVGAGEDEDEVEDGDGDEDECGRRRPERVDFKETTNLPVGRW